MCVCYLIYDSMIMCVFVCVEKVFVNVRVNERVWLSYQLMLCNYVQRMLLFDM